MKIALGCDHTGLELKLLLKEHLEAQGYETHDFGTYTEASCDYPVYAAAVAKAVANGEYERGLLICGTGVGMSLAANKVRGIRCVACSEPYSALLSRRHNDANILALGARVVGSELAKMILDQWMAGEFEGGRHAGRVAMITALDNERG